MVFFGSPYDKSLEWRLVEGNRESMINAGSPSVALLVPFYNHARYIRPLLQQAAEQSVAFSEIIFYNDGSTDGSAEIARQLGASVIDSNVNRRQSFARNRLLEAAVTPFVHFHDVDDPLNPQFLEKMTPLINPETVAIGSLREVNVDGTSIIHNVSGCASVDSVSFAITHYVHLNAVIFPRAMVMAVGGFEEGLTLYEEKLLLQKLALSGACFSFEGEIIAEWVKRPNSFIHSHSWAENADMLEKYACRSLELFSEDLHEGELAQYLFRKCFEYYYYERAVLPILSRIMATLNDRGYRQIIGMGDKVRLLSSILPSSAVVRLHYWWSELNRGRVLSSS
jgi:glycosyltransferase involved in cell wall biosynthesis